MADKAVQNHTQRNNRYAKRRPSSSKVRHNSFRRQYSLGKRNISDRTTEETFASSLCKDCGEKGHDRGDPVFKHPSAFTKFLNKRKINKSHGGSDHDQNRNGDSFFRRSSHSEGN